MISKGLLVRMEAKPGKDRDVEEFLLSALPMVRQEADTTAWFAIRFGRAEYGIFDVFPDDESRDAHLSGPVARALMEKADTLFATPPVIHKLDVVASKVPASAPVDVDTKGLLVTFAAQEGHQPEAEAFLRDAQPMVEDEPETTAWFAIRLDDGKYGIFDVFPNNGGRFKHLVGRVPRAMAMKAPRLMSGVPDMDMLNVVAEKQGGEIAQAGW
ncbi:MAG: hypothetical protein HY661_15815 [Betaproteobacteria bacterium]|nr:hypothetical protein [Betaproteobacteria bacterium]